MLLSGKPPHTSPLKTVLTVNLLSSVHRTFCLLLSRCGWVEPAAVPQQRRAELPAEGLLPALAAPSEGEPITACSEGHMPCGPTPTHLCTLSAGEPVAGADAGLFRCWRRGLSLPQSPTPDWWVVLSATTRTRTRIRSLYCQKAHNQIQDANPSWRLNIDKM